MIALVVPALSLFGRAHAEAIDGAHPPPRAAPIDRGAGVVNVNSASEAELARLPGIGPGKAKAIVDHRRGHPFHKVDDLMRVKGIGRKTFGRVRPYLTTVGATTLTTAVKPRHEPR
jgi:competence protein ComEA